jgi:hypothetical protein
MALSNRQRNIVNPFVQGDYNYSTERSKWMQAGIHDSIVNFGIFPQVGKVIAPVPYNDDEDQILRRDLDAYIATYPQNARFKGQVFSDKSDKQGLEALQSIAAQLNQRGLVRFYTSPTSPESYDPENQENINGNSDNPEDITKEIVSQLIAINPSVSLTKLRNIRISFDNPVSSVLEIPQEPINDESVVPFRTEVDSIDLFDWRNNALPGENGEVSYYNPNDEKYYFVKRTVSTDPRAYDKSLLSNDNISQIRSEAAAEVLRSVAKYTDQAKVLLANSGQLRTYLDPRPASRWTYTVTFSKQIVDSIPQDAASVSRKDDDYTPLEKAKLLLNLDQGSLKNTTTRHATYTLDILKTSLKNTTNILRDYSDLMVKENITPDMVSGFDIEKDSLQLDTVYDTMDLLFQYNGIDIDDNSRTGIEFAFRKDMRINYIVVDGYLYTAGLGNTFLVKGTGGVEPETSSNVVDVFSTYSNRTVGFIYLSRKINADIYEKPKNKRMNWNQFLLTYVEPRVKILPAQGDRKKKSKTLKLPEPKGLFQRADDIFKPTGADLSKLSISGKDTLILVNNAVGSCDTAQSSALKSLVKIYSIFAGKYPIKVLIREAVLLAREELLKSELDKARLDQAVAYAENPTRIRKEIETAINEEISCLIDLLGTEINKQILDPAGVPPSVRQLVKNELPNPMTFKFGRTPNFQNVWALWKKALEKMLVAFIKQLIMGILQDVLKAALGCGPLDDSELKVSENERLYNLVSLNDFLKGIDIVEIGKEIGFTDKKITVTNSEIKIITSDPRLEQLRQFNSDVSAIVTPKELGRLLDGDAEEALIKSIDEMVNAGKVDVNSLREFSGGQTARVGGQYGIDVVVGGDIELRKNKVLMSKFQESLEDGDERYAILGIDKTNIINYFIEIGNKMSPEIRDMLDRSPTIFPEDAFCDDRTGNPANFLFDVGLSETQVLEQLQDDLDAKRIKIISLCSALKGNLNFQLEIDSFLDGLPNSKIYDLILQWIADLSNQIANAFADDIIPDDRQVTPRARSFSQSEFGKSIIETASKNGMMQYAAPEFRDARDQQIVFKSSTGIQDGNHIQHIPITWQDAQKMNYITPLDTIGNRVIVDPRKFGEDIGYIYVGKELDRDEHLIYPSVSPPSEYGNPVPSPAQDAGDGHIMLWINNGEFRLYWRDKVSSGFYGNNNPDQRRLLSSGRLAARNKETGTPYSIAMNTEESNIAKNQIGTYSQLSAWLKTSEESGRRKIRGVSNTYSIIYANIENFYFNDIARTRLPGFTRALAKPLFKSNLDDCISDRDEYIAKSIVASIQSRLVLYFMNVGPVFPAYPTPNTPDTNRAITNYLVGKITKDFKDKGLFGPIAQNMNKVKLVFGELGQHNPSFYDARKLNEDKLLYTDELSDSELLEQLIKQSYFVMLRQISSQSAYKMLNGCFEPGFYEDQYRGAARLLKNAMLEFGTDQQKQQLADDGVSDESWLSKYSLYQLPAPLLVAMQYLLFDYVVKPMERYPKFKFETESRIAYADDQVLTSINPSHLSITKFSSQFSSFPITVNGETFYYLEDLEERAREELAQSIAADEQVIRNQNELDDIVAEIQTKQEELFSAIRPIKEEMIELFEEVERQRAIARRTSRTPDVVVAIATIIPAIGYTADAALVGDINNTYGNIASIQAWQNYLTRLVLNRTLAVELDENFVENFENINSIWSTGREERIYYAASISQFAEGEVAWTAIERMYTTMLAIMRKDRDYVNLILTAKRGAGGLDQLGGQRATFTTLLNDSKQDKITEAQESSVFVNAVNSIRNTLELPPFDPEEQ